MRVNDSMVGANRDALSGSVYQRSLGQGTVNALTTRHLPSKMPILGLP